MSINGRKGLGTGHVKIHNLFFLLFHEVASSSVVTLASSGDLCIKIPSLLRRIFLQFSYLKQKVVTQCVCKGPLENKMKITINDQGVFDPHDKQFIGHAINIQSNKNLTFSLGFQY